jgi:hypothetical protein
MSTIAMVIHYLKRRIFMRSRTMLVTLAVLSVVFIAQMSLAGQKLRYNFLKGKVYKYSTVVESKTSGQAMGQEFTLTSGADFDYTVSLVDRKDGIMTLQVTYEKFTMKINMPMMGFNDSTIVMKEYIGKRVKVVATDRGKTLSVETIDTIPPSREQQMAGLNPKDLFKQMLLEFPEKEVSMNDSWKKDLPDTTSRSGLNIVTKYNVDFKIVAEEKKNDFPCWKIAIGGTSTIEGSGSQRGADVAIDGTVKIHGSAYIAPAEGVFVLSEQSSETDMTTTATGSQTGASTMSINTTAKTMLVK